MMMRSELHPARAISAAVLFLALTACARDDATAPKGLSTVGLSDNVPVIVTVTDLGPLPPAGRTARANGINNQGTIVGSAFTGGVPGKFVAFSWTEQGGAAPLTGTLGFESSEANAINERGDVVGTRTPGPGVGLVWTRDGRVVEIPEMTIAHSINNRGTVVGASISGTAVLWTERDGVRNLGGFFALDINESDDVVGQAAGPSGARAALWPRAGALVLLPTEPAVQSSAATGINNRGEVVGFIGPFFNSMGFVWSEQKGLRMLATPPGLFSHPEAINNRGEIAGWLTNGGSSGVGRAVMWSASGRLVMLDPLAPGAASQAFDINDRGEIVGSSASADPNDAHAVLWTLRE